MAKSARLKCICCSAEFDEDDPRLESAPACPACQSQNTPCLVSEEVQVRLNWLELRILAVWSRAAIQASPHEHLKIAISAILDRLEAQKPGPEFESLVVVPEEESGALKN